MNRFFNAFVILTLIGVIISGCARQRCKGTKFLSYEDGTYRGVFIDRDEIQVGVEFTLQDNIVTEIEFRRLHAQGDEYLDAEDGTREAMLRDEYKKIINHLVGKDIRTHLDDLYYPGNIANDVDGLTAATMRSPKMISAIRDGLLRGVYSY